jgi:hypothetical protein
MTDRFHSSQVLSLPEHATILKAAEQDALSDALWTRDVHLWLMSQPNAIEVVRGY